MAKITISPREYTVTLSEDEFRLIKRLLAGASGQDDIDAEVPEGTGYDLYRNFLDAA